MKYILLFFPFLLFCQINKVTFLDEISKKPLVGLQVFAGNGSFITDTNFAGQVELELQQLRKKGINSVIAYNTDYFSTEYKLSEIPDVIYLKKNEVIQLDPVVIKPRKSKEYFGLKAYFRSWQLVNDKLVKYGDGIVTYQVPYSLVDNGDYNTGVKKYFTAYRTFKGDSIKTKSRYFISIGNDSGYLDTYIPISDMLKRRYYYKVKQKNDRYSSVYEDGKEVGYVIYDESNTPIEINTSNSFEGEEAIKMLIWKISGKYKEIEKWTGYGNTRHPSYLFNSTKTTVKTKIKGKYNDVETITEIFIDDEILDSIVKPKKRKSYIDKSRSFYNLNYWDEQIQKHPLPSEIKLQLTNVNENKNIY